MEGLLLIAVVILFIMTINLRGRMKKLEGTGVKHATQPQSTSLPQQTQQTPDSQHATKETPPWVNPVKTTSSKSNTVDSVINWIKEDWLLKLGALLLLIAFGWFASYAFLHNWIGPMGRIILGVVAGVAFMGFGTWRMHKYVQQGSVFLVLGSTVVLLTLFAARELYNFFTPTTALAAMFITATFVAFMSVRVNSKILGLISLALSAIAPFFTNMPSPNYVWLFSYLAVVTVGVLWIVVVTGWRELTFAALLLVAAYSWPHLTASIALQDSAADLVWFAYGFAALFFVASFLGILGVLKGDKKMMEVDMITAAVNGLLLLWWILRAAPEDWKSIIMLGCVVAFAAAAFLALKKTNNRIPFYVYVGTAIVFLVAATAIEIDGTRLVIAYTIESILIPVLVHLALRDTRVTQLFSVLLVGPMLLSGGSITASAWRAGVFHEEFVVLLLLALVLGAFGVYFWRQGERAIRELSIGSVIVGSGYVYLLLWLSLHAALVSDDIAVMIALVVYTLCGLATHFYGKLHERKGFEYYGGVVLGFVVVRLLFVDVWNMELTGRIITFFLIGTLLVSTAFIGRKKKSQTTTL